MKGKGQTVRIMFVTPGMRFGGAERVMSILANNFVEQNYEICFVVMDDEKQLAYPLDGRIDLRYMQTARFNKIGNLPKLIRTLRFHIKSYRPEVIVSFFSTTLAFSWIASWGMGIPLVFSERNDPYNNINSFKAKLFQAIALNCTQHVVFQTAGAQGYYNKKINQKSSVILNPFDSSLLPSIICSKSKVIASVGRLNPQKNQMLLIDAFYKIAESYPEYTLVIYGEGSLRQSLQKRIDRYGLNDRISLPGNDNKVLEKIQNSMLFVFSSDFEGLPNALIEAMAMGLPCVSTDCSPGGAKELIDNYKNGILVPCGDVDKMVEAITYMLDHPAEAEMMGKEARKVLERLNVRTICKKWADVLEIASKY